MNKEELISMEALERLDRIFDKTRKIETDSDLLELAELVEDESKDDEKDDIHDSSGDDAGDRSGGSTAADRA